MSHKTRTNANKQLEKCRPVLDRVMIDKDDQYTSDLINEHFLQMIKQNKLPALAACVEEMVEIAIKSQLFWPKCFVFVLWIYCNKRFRDQVVFTRDDEKRQKMFFKRLVAVLDTQNRGCAIKYSNEHFDEPKEYAYYETNENIEPHMLNLGYLITQLCSYWATLLAFEKKHRLLYLK